MRNSAKTLGLPLSCGVIEGGSPTSFLKLVGSRDQGGGMNTGRCLEIKNIRKQILYFFFLQISGHTGVFFSIFLSYRQNTPLDDINKNSRTRLICIDCFKTFLTNLFYFYTFIPQIRKSITTCIPLAA